MYGPNTDNDNDNDKPIKCLLKGKGLLPLVGLAWLDSYGELLPMSCIFSIFSVGVRLIIWFTLSPTLFCIIRLTLQRGHLNSAAVSLPR
jgi:hypothetical protein